MECSDKGIWNTVNARNNVKSHLKRAILSFFSASALFLWVSVYIVHLSINDINFSTYDFFLSCVLTTLAAGVALFVITSLLALIRLNWLGSGLLYFILFWACLSGFMLPLVLQAGMVSPDKLSTDTDNLYLVAGAALLLTLVTFTRLKAAAQAFAVILTVTTVGAALPSFNKPEASVSRFTGLSETDNVLVLSFDGLAGNIAKQLIEENPQLKAAFKDFTFFDNAIAPAPATWASLRAEVYGNFNYRDMVDPQGKPLKEFSSQFNSIQREQANGTDVVVYGAYTAYNQTPTDQITPLTLGSGTFIERAATAFSFYPYVAARMGTALAATFVEEQVRALNTAYPLDSKTQRALEYKGDNKWDVPGTLQNDDMITFIDKLHVTGSPRSVRYMHMLHTHFPVDFDENCTYRSNDREWHSKNQNYQGLLNETHCALKQTASLIEKLKALGIYDKTLFIVKSDHGAPVTYLGDDADNYMINRHPLWGYNRYRPLLLIKGQNQSSENLAYDSRIASLSDLAKTLCVQTPGQHLCEAYSGVDLLDPNAYAPDQMVYVDVVKDEKSTFSFDTHMTVAVPRNASFKDGLLSTGKIALSSQMTTFEQRKKDLESVKAALEAYHRANGKYPVSKGFDGLHSTWGKDTAEYITGLVPKFIPKLPLDPSNSSNQSPQYIYASDGKNYKLIAHGQTSSCTFASKLHPEMLDPMRNCWGFGFWTSGGSKW